MATFARRILMMIPTLFAVSILAFVIIDLPPGDWLTDYVSRLRAQDIQMNEEAIASLRSQYGFDQPLPVRYVKWIGRVVRGDFGQSFQYNQPVRQLIGERMA